MPSESTSAEGRYRRTRLLLSLTDGKRRPVPAPGRQLQRNADRRGPKIQNQISTQRPSRQGHPPQWAGTDDDDSRQTSRVEEAGKLQHQPIPGLDPYIGYSNPASLVPVR